MQRAHTFGHSRDRLHRLWPDDMNGLLVDDVSGERLWQRDHGQIKISGLVLSI